MAEDPRASETQLPAVCEPHYKPRTDGSKMKALVYHGRRDVRVQEVDVPDITQPVSHLRDLCYLNPSRSSRA